MNNIQKKNVNLSKICTKYLDRQILNPSQHASQSTNDNFFSLKSKYIHIWELSESYRSLSQIVFA